MSTEIFKSSVELAPCPTPVAISIDKSKLTKLPLARIASGAGIAASLAEPLRTAKTFVDAGIAGGEGLYRVTFNNGITGSLAQFHDGSGFTATIVNNGIVGNARLNPVDAAEAATVVPVDPMTLAIAIAVASIDKKLDTLIETQKEIIDFLDRDKKAELESNLNALNSIKESLESKWNNKDHVQAALIQVMDAKRKADQNIIFYSGRVKDIAAKKSFLHLDMGSSEKLEKMQEDFNQYRLALYIYSYATFLENILSKSFSEANTAAAAGDIQQRIIEYRYTYTDCYNMLEEYSKSSAETFAKAGAAFALKGLGKVISKIPVIEKSPVDEALLSAGSAVESVKESHAEKVLEIFTANKECGSQPFVETIETIGRLCNKPIELLIDGEDAYLLDEPIEPENQ